jgi:hypothetical protein
MIMGTSLVSAATKNNTAINSVIDSFVYEDGSWVYDEEDYGDEIQEDTENNTTEPEKDWEATSYYDSSSKNENTSAGEYLLDLDWGDYINKFSFQKPDYYTAVDEGKDIVNSGNMYAYYKIDTNADPNYSQTFWARFYQDMYNKNYRRVSNMVEWFRGKAKADGWSAYDLADQVVKCIQVIPYERPYNVITDTDQAANALDYFTPNEVAWYNKGDCDTKSMLIVMLLRQLGYDAVIYYSAHYEHAMAGVSLNATGTSKTYQGKKYYFIESTYPGWSIGDLPPDFGEPDYWTLVPIK